MGITVHGHNANLYQQVELGAVVTRADGYVENHRNVTFYHRNPIYRVIGNAYCRVRHWALKVRFFFGRRIHRYKKGLSPWRLTST